VTAPATNTDFEPRSQPSMTQSSTSALALQGSATKHVVVDESTTGGPRQFLNKGCWGLKAELGDACLFDSHAVALRNINKMIGMDWERIHGVKLVLGQVSVSLLRVDAPVERKALSGFILRRRDGQYYCGPKGRNANSFLEANYRYKPNPDVATVFKSEAQAAERAEGILIELRKAVRPTDTDQNRRVYEQCVERGRCAIIPV